jgi:hypothetical protein
VHGAPIRSQLIRHVEANVGKLLYVEDVARDIGRTERSVSSGMYNLRREVPEFREKISVVVAGKVWRVNDNGESTSAPVASTQPPAQSVNGSTSAPTARVPTRIVSNAESVVSEDVNDDADAFAVSSKPGRLFEELGDVGDGCILVVDEAGNPYKLVPLNS